MTVARGFTLVELAITMTVAALLMVVILRNTGLLVYGDVIHITGIAKDIVKVTSEFRDRYRFMPGDLPDAKSDLPGVGCSGNGNGVVDSDETACAADQLNRAGLTRSPILSSKYGDGVVLGKVRIIARAQGVAKPHPGTVRNVVEFYDVPCEVARRVDAKIDDNSFSTGSLLAVFESAPNVWEAVPADCAFPAADEKKADEKKVVAPERPVVISQALR